MRKSLIILSIATFSAALFSCRGAGGEYPGDAYAPDMYYSRAYETYGYNSVDSYDSLNERTVHFRYNAMPVPGTIARGDGESYPFPNTDTGYIQSRAYSNPYDTAMLSTTTMAEAERLYLIHCAICHGSKLDGQGPIFTNGSYPAAPRPLNGDYARALADGQIYHVITHGKGQMGSYASQVHPEQRWWIVQYIRSKQSTSAGSDTTAAQTRADSTAAANK